MYVRGDKEDDFDTIRYEIDMLDYAYRTLPAKDRAGEPGEFNAYLECFLLHYRNLVEFFGRDMTRKDGTDLRVFNPEAWAPKGVNLSQLKLLKNSALCDKYWERLSRYLEHITTYRADDPLTWNVREMYSEFNPTLTKFEQITHLPRLMPGGGAVSFVDGASTASFTRQKVF